MAVQLPGWVTIWLLISSVVCLWDASFIVFRPDTLPGGKYNWFWKPYNKYVEVDKRYGDMKDSFIVIQSLMNYAEVFLNVVALLLNAMGSGKSFVLALTASVMTWWKTVLYVSFYLPQFATPETALPNDPVEATLFFWLPNSIWLVLPFAVMLGLGGRLAPQGDNKSGAAAAKSKKTK